jgi:integrase
LSTTARDYFLSPFFRGAPPAAANEFLKSMRAVLGYLVGVDELKDNAAELVKYNAISTEGFHTWTLDEVAQYVENHRLGSKAVLALALLLFTGQRRGDVIKMGPQHVKDGLLRLRRGKSAGHAARLDRDNNQQGESAGT